jgi:tRNA pseudouridine55 synthase
MARKRRRGIDEAPGPAGFLVVDKAPGQTSHDVVDAARGWLGTRRVGHLGTLDPQATGVLPLAIREATKLVPFLQDAEKSYVGCVRLGVETDTLDAEGRVLRRHSGALPDEASVRRALSSFVGTIEQVPPMYSAVKRGGVPLHRLARRGEEVEREPKKVQIRRVEVLRFESPDVEIVVECGPGTYVRSLAADLGRALGCGAHLAQLRRTRSGPFTLEHALGCDLCAAEAEAGRLEARLIPPEQVLGFPVVKLAPPAAERVRHGGDISPGMQRVLTPGSRVSALGGDDKLLAILELRADRRLWPLRVLASDS